jgi:quercetin dioxygenase-like cupin family protein
MAGGEERDGAQYRDDVLIDSESLPWTTVSPTLDVRMLNWDPSSGAYALLMRYKAGAVVGPHRHLAPAEFYVVSGRMVYEAGTAGPGFWGIEPTGAVHAATQFPEQTVLLFRCAGATARLDETGKVIGIVEGRDWHALCAGTRAPSA